MIRVLVVDDSPVMRRVLTAAMQSAPDIEVVGAAADPYIARDRIVELKPDVLTLDIEMPRMNGLTFLQKLMKYFPLPVVVISSFTQQNSQVSLRALEYGAVEVMGKPDSEREAQNLSRLLKYKVRAAAAARVGKPLEKKIPDNVVSGLNLSNTAHKILAMGASTGGTEAVKQVLCRLPKTVPGIVLVQHLPPAFTPFFIKHLNEICPLEVREAKDGERLQPGMVLIAPGDRHLLIRRNGIQFVTQIKYGPQVYYQRPSVEVLFNSIAKQAGDKAVGVLLTGMGEDGARGLLAMRQAGAYTIAQDEKTSLVYGMPKVAAELGGAQAVMPLPRIAGKIVQTLQN